MYIAAKLNSSIQIALDLHTNKDNNRSLALANAIVITQMLCDADAP